MEEEESARSFQGCIDSANSNYIVAAVGNLDPLLWSTYRMAFKHSTEAQVSQGILSQTGGDNHH